MLDTRKKLETPESIDLEILIAGPIVRMAAFIIDWLIRIALYIVLSVVLGFFGKTGMGVFLIALFAVEWFYPVVFEVLKQGQTPGKRNMGIAMVNDDNTPIRWSASIVRNFLRGIDFLPIGYLLGMISMIVNRDFKRIGDLAAGTIVIYRIPHTPPPKHNNLTQSPPPIAFTLPQQRAILGFSERQNTLTPERQQELANHLQPVLHKQDQHAVDALLKIAAWLRGSH